MSLAVASAALADVEPQQPLLEEAASPPPPSSASPPLPTSASPPLPTSASPQPPPLASPSPPPPAATVELEATFDVVPTPPSESLELRGPPRQPSLEEASHAGSVARSPNPPISAQLPQTASPDEAPDAVSTSLAAPPPAESAEPPTAAPAPAPAFVRHSSPKTTDTRLDTSWEYRQLSDLIQCMPASVVRQVVRDQSDRCLLGSEYHHGFVIKKALRQATWPMLDSAAQEVGEQLARISRPHIMAHVTSQDLDELADAVLAKASNKFLDKGMARRLETIRARQLVNALARAERLGYDVRDIVEEKTAYGAEHVVPSPGALPAMGMPPQAMQTPPAVTLASQPMQSQPMQSQQHQASSQAAARHPAPAAAPNQHGILHCAACSRPCSGEQALRYHTARRACDHSHKVHRVGKDLCQHCGCLFTSNGGLAYHVKSKVCGDYSEATEKAVLAELYAQHWHTSPPRDMMPGSPAQPRPAGTPGQHKMAGTPGQHTMTITPQHKTPGQMVAAAVNPGSVSSRPTPGHTPNGTSSHPYANLTPEARRNFEHEMQQAEEKYGALMRNALMLPDKAKQEEELTRLKNSYNTKQSVTRKKYGIRLRERRSKAEIEQERNRLIGAHGGGDGHGPPAKRSRLSGEPPTVPVPSTQAPDAPLAGPVAAVAALAALAEAPPAASGLSGGLAGSSGPAEHTDPTTLVKPAEPRSAAQLVKGTPEDPMQIDSSGDSDNEDIPAHVPGQ